MSLRSVWFIGIADYKATRCVEATLDDAFHSHLADGIFERFYGFGDVLLGMNARGETAVAAHQVNAVVQHTPLKDSGQRRRHARRRRAVRGPFDAVALYRAVFAQHDVEV